MSSKPKLRVGLVFDDSLDSSDGVAQYVKTLGTWLSAQGHQVSYLVGETKLGSWQGGRVYSLSKNINVHFNGNKLSMPLLTKPAGIKQVIDNEKLDVLHIMVPYSPLMAQKVIKYAPQGVAVVGTFHIFPSGWLARAGGRILKLVYGRSLGRFNAVVSVSRAAQSYARASFGLETKVVPNPVNISLFANQKPAHNNAPRIVFLGRLVKRKGCAQLIKAFAELNKVMPDVELFIAGDGPQRQLLDNLCVKLKIANKVTFLGFIDEADKANLLASADIACFPSLYGESFGIVLIEAMAAGSKIVLGGNNPGYSSVLDQQPMLLVDPNDIAGFARRLQTLLKPSKQIDDLHQWQLETVAQYDIKIVGRKILNVYGQAIAQSSKKSHNDSHER